jgi:ABC-type uncharacterized transport system substrate-binding protein
MNGQPMRRRAFITLFGGAAWPLAARAQQPPMPVIGWLSGRTAKADALFLPNFIRALSAHNFVEGRNVAFEYRFADGQTDRLPSLAAELLQKRVSVMVTVGGTAVAVAAKGIADASTPIVFAIGVDPVKAGLVASFNRPGGNLTGMTDLLSSLASKRLGLLREMVPHATTVAILTNPTSPGATSDVDDTREAARTIRQDLQIVNARSDRELDAAFATLAEMRPGALQVIADPFFFTRADKIIAAAAAISVPTLYFRREFAAVGGLMSYGSTIEEVYKVLGDYTGRILKGAKAADLPVQQPTKFEFVINLTTAKALGLLIPAGLLAIADEVVE